MQEIKSSKIQLNTSVFITVVHVGAVLEVNRSFFKCFLNIFAQVTYISNIVCAEKLYEFLHRRIAPIVFFNFLTQVPVCRAYKYKMIFVLNISILIKL